MDTARRYVRQTGERPDGFIEFEFAIGDPDVFAELILTKDAFAEFCAANSVIQLPPRDPNAPEGDWDWRISDATTTHFRTGSG